MSNIYNIHNFKIIIPDSNTDGIFINLIKNKTWEPKITNYLLNYIKDNKIDAFIDIGANIGYYTLLLASYNIKTYSFEPNKINFKLLTENIELNNFNNSITYNIGLGDKNDNINFYYNTEKSGHGSCLSNIKNKQNLYLEDTIKINKLDNMNITDNNILLKIDIEGYEYNALLGMKEMLSKKQIKCLCIEISRVFYGKGIEKQIISFLKTYFKTLYIIQTENTLQDTLPQISQYDIVCFN